MSEVEPVPLWLRIGRESLWGKRGLIKTGSLWFPLAALLAIYGGPRRPGVAWGCLVLFAMAACRTLGCILANDLADRASDTAAGKQRWILDVPSRVGQLVVCCLCLAGVAVSVFAMGAAAAFAYTASLALGIAYSVPPARLKERGLLGMVGYALSGALAYAVVPSLWLGGDKISLCLLGSAVFFDKWVNLHFHQVVDYEADHRANGGTLNVQIGLASLRRTLQWAAWAAAVAMAGCLVLLVVEAPRYEAAAWLGLALTVAAAAYALWQKERGRGSSLVRELPCAYLGLTYALFSGMPPVLFVWMATIEPSMWLPAALSGGLCLLQSWHASRYRYE
jgi:1,4-dihydroxy-2-naphthoate octaprenyltransferase